MKTGLWLDTKRLDACLPGMCEPPVTAGRMASADPGEMRPEVGRALAHREGVALVERYIRAMKGDCARDDGPTETAAR